MENIRTTKSPAGETYVIEEERGSGATSKVYSARRVRDNRQVAIKFLQQRGHIARTRFRREAWAYDQFRDCPFVVRLLDQNLMGASPYLVQEFCVHGSARQQLGFLRSQPKTTIALLGHVAVALETIHRRGCLYRDLKPDNLLLTENESRQYVMKLGDAGLICLPGEYGLPLATRNALGTLPYMAPELFQQGAQYSREAEIFAFGVTACEMLTTIRPVAGSSIILGPGEVRSLLQRMIAKAPAERPTISQVRSELQRAYAEIEKKDQLITTIVGGGIIALLVTALLKKKR
jgi:eukaryotic-like serine/threonine-protein kinase